MQTSLANQNKQECQACLKISTSYGSRTRDLRLERAASLATRRTRLTDHSLDCTLVLLVIAAIIGIFFFLSKQSTSNGSPTPTTEATTGPAVLQAVTNVSPAVSAAVGTGGQNNVLTPLKGSPPPPALTGPNGKPEFFYAGAEYCPFCAAQRWAVVVVLSRFGTFSKLNQTTSSATDSFPNTATFSFYQSAYTSRYIYFDSVEQTTNQPDGAGGYTAL